MESDGYVGAVSAEAACEMAKGVRKVSGAIWDWRRQGSQAPIRGRSAKPIGTAYIALVGAEGVVCKDFRFDGGRDAIRNEISDAALQMVIEAGENS